MHQASAAIEGLNNVQNGTGMPLLVRYVSVTALLTHDALSLCSFPLACCAHCSSSQTVCMSSSSAEKCLLHHFQRLVCTSQPDQLSPRPMARFACRFADTPEEKARKLAKKAAMPPSKFSSFDILQSLAGAYPLSLDGMQPGLPAGFTSFSAAGIPDANGKLDSKPAEPSTASSRCQLTLCRQLQQSPWYG